MQPKPRVPSTRPGLFEELEEIRYSLLGPCVAAPNARFGHAPQFHSGADKLNGAQSRYERYTVVHEAA
jgi:hypothetical protein